ncbi:hypothetical protein MBO_02827 [Moraxella bovoculi 237]|uniref:DUF6471 domain-containing protein n=1 Tax=Moraxella bovoculi 237 TaxID=743974 RepID=A0A066UN95_9GAMM|nr:DUF6471 domain-containing protein [Moraxella bovoculi]KDN25619.1 hypothetical protein MBO_02827 [Moraxella bovoculi 237]
MTNQAQNPSDENYWKDYVRGLLKAEIARRNISYVEISEKLAEQGIHESPQNISNKIARGTFGAIFMVQVLKIIECEEIKFV